MIMHGGGNLGDIWPHHQRLREAIAERYRGVFTIVMPQSVEFTDDEKSNQAARIFRRHGNMYICVRDESSMRFVQQCDLPGAVLPDMAHFLWKASALTSNADTPGADALVQVRRDEEIVASSQTASRFDWEDLVSNRLRLADLGYRAWRRINPINSVLPNWKAWETLRARLVQRSVDRFAGAQEIETDRLHGVILSALLSKRVRFSDRSNLYPKLTRYYETWLKGSPLISSQ
jgi:pyruvyl transferase EpsO